MKTSAASSALYTDPVLARAYADVTAHNVCNAAYERPAVRSLLGDVSACDVLDAGCAAGEHAAWLIERGARVVALDASAAMVALTVERLGAAGRVVQADLAHALPFADASFDIVLSSLTMHYVRDWGPTLREFRRVLRAGGRFVMSTHHPNLTEARVTNSSDVTVVDDAWSGFADLPVPVQFYHRPFARMTDDLAHAGFAHVVIREPAPHADAEELDPPLAAALRERAQFATLEALRDA